MIEPLLKGRRLSKPLIAAVEGPAIAGGTEILQACDIRVAGESARFGVSEARWGLFPLGGSAVRLPRQIPYTLAADLLLTGRHIRAAEALSMGLIGHVVPDGQALAKALEIADAIAANGPVAVRAILAAMRETEGMAENDAFAIEAKLGAAVFASDDAREGPRAFAEKRRPEFRTPDGWRHGRGAVAPASVRDEDLSLYRLIARGPVRIAQPPLVELPVGVARELGDVVDRSSAA